jgi:hypothetical protein
MNPMQTLEGTNSEYDKKAILAALHHLSRCLGPEAHRPAKVKQGMGKKGFMIGWVTAIPSRLCMGQKVAPCPKAVGYPRFLTMMKPDRAHHTSGTKSPDVGQSGDSPVVAKQRLGPVQYSSWQYICQFYKWKPYQI